MNNKIKYQKFENVSSVSFNKYKILMPLCYHGIDDNNNEYLKIIINGIDLKLIKKILYKNKVIFSELFVYNVDLFNIFINKDENCVELFYKCINIYD